MTQSQALDMLKLGHNVFLTGAPGAGKTYVLGQYIAFLQANSVYPAITAYTGIAASHLNGRTLHSWAGLKRGVQHDPRQERDRILNNQKLTDRISAAKVLIIDEISMLHPQEFDRVDFICKTARRSVEPFGGLQVICCGDFFQIPPVHQEEDRFVLDSAAWEAARMKTCYLHEQHRHGDKTLLAILEEIRRGSVRKESIAILKGRMNAVIEAPIGIAQLYTHNEDVDEINSKELLTLKEPEVVYEVEEEGPVGLTARLKKENRVERISLRVGARVMCTRNNPGMGYVNGTLGEVVGFYDQNPVVMTFDHKKIVVSREAWSIEENDTIVASINQIPLRLAWAITVHKSQGMTLDAARIDLSNAFERGMGYVALSRVRTLENISLLGFNALSLEVNDRIKKLDDEFWMQSTESEKYLTTVGIEKMATLQKQFLESIQQRRSPEDEYSYEPDEEIPMIDFEGYPDESSY